MLTHFGRPCLAVAFLLTILLAPLTAQDQPRRPSPFGPPAEKPPAAPSYRLLVPQHPPNAYPELVKFDPASGKTWYKDRGPSMRLVTEAAPVPAGEYDVQAALLEGTIVQIVRIDRRTGQIWYTIGSGNREGDEYEGEGVWKLILDKPAANAASKDERYDLQLARTDQKAFISRISRRTGQGMILFGSKWLPLADDPAVPASDYDLQLVMTDNPKVPLPFRFDRSTGKTFVPSNKGLWTALDETGPPPKPSGLLFEQGYQLHVVPVFEAYSLLRYHPTTGQTWQGSEDGSQWEPVKEPQELPAADYALVHFRAEKDLAIACRMDRKTGRAWAWGEGEWVPIAEPDAAQGPGRADAGEGFQLRTAGGDKLYQLVRFNPRTGQIWRENGKAQWVRIPAPTMLAAGNYDCQVAVSGEDGAYTTLLDHVTGRWWGWEKDEWQELRPAAPATDQQPRYEQRLVATKDGCQAIRFDRQSGAVWKWDPTSLSNRVYQVFEPAPIPAGDYQVELAAYGGPRRGSAVMSRRLDQRTGRVWIEEYNTARDDLRREFSEMK